MLPRVTSVRHVVDYELEIGFVDGSLTKLDFRKRIVGRGGVFAPLENVDCFRKVAVDPEAGTLVWPNGVDLCPDVLYSEATGKPIASAALGLSGEKSAVGGKLPVEANVTPA